MKAIVILGLLAILVALVAIPAGAVIEREVEQARANRIEEQARLEIARADAYAVRSQANQPAMVATVGIVVLGMLIGSTLVVMISRRSVATVQAPIQAVPPVSPQIHVIVVNQLPGESRPEYLRRIGMLTEPHAERLVAMIDQRRTIDAERR